MSGKKKQTDYFALLLRLNDYSCTAARQLRELTERFSPSAMPDNVQRIHTVEHSADAEKHSMMRLLAREFITPIDRDDIFSLAAELDNVTDAIDDVAMRLYIYGVQTLRPEAAQFAELIQRCVMALREALEAFSDFRRRADRVNACVIAVNTLEEEGDRLYTQALRRLYASETDAPTLLAWTQLFERLEMCCDACEHASDVIEGVLMSAQ